MVVDRSRSMSGRTDSQEMIPVVGLVEVLEAEDRVRAAVEDVVVEEVDVPGGELVLAHPDPDLP